MPPRRLRRLVCYRLEEVGPSAAISGSDHPQLPIRVLSYWGAGLPEAGFGGGIQGLQGGGYGKQLKNDYRRYYGAYIGFSGRGEMIPNDGSYCEIDPQVVDRWGIPVLRFHWQWTDHEYLQVKHMQETFRALIKEMGGTPWGDMPSKEDGYGIAAGGVIIHEVGGAIMGTDPAKSVTNSYGQSWEMKNLFITDGATLCSNADKNPTLTIMALAWRSADHMLGLMKRKEL